MCFALCYYTRTDKYPKQKLWVKAMRITKKQVAVITLLNLIIAALIGTIFLLSHQKTTGQAQGDKPNIDAPDQNGDGNGDIGTVTPPHEKLRPATDGLVKEISRETRLMGSGDETVIFAHVVGGVTYVFGNAVVGDYDFDSSGGFVCRLDSSGKILGFTYLSGKLTAAGVIEGGFGAATVGNAEGADKSCTLYCVDGDGNVTSQLGLDGEAIKVLSVGSKRMAVVTALGKSTLKLTEYNLTGGVWALGNSTRISDGLSVDFFDCYYMREQYIISARAYSENKYDATVFYTFKAGGDATPHYNGGVDDASITPYAVQPYADGFMALCAYRGEAAIVTADYSFTSFRRDMLGIECDGASLAYSNGVYYASVTGGGVVTVFEIDNELNHKKISGADGTEIKHAVKMDETIFIGYSAQKVVVSDGGSTKITLDIKNADIARAFKTGYNTIMLVLSANGGSAVTKPTGERDVYVAEVIL